MDSLGPIRRYSEPILAWEYDQRNHMNDEEFNWYYQHVCEAGGPVLEYACGSGRLTIPLAEKGFTITGVDNSEAMLNRLILKMNRLHDETKQRINSECRDMLEYSPDKSFRTIIIPCNSLQYLSTKARILSFLNRIYRLLETGCILLIVIQNRNFTSLLNGERVVIDWLDTPIIDKKNGISVATKTVEYFDPKADVLIKERTYQIIEPGKDVQTIEDRSSTPAISVHEYVEMMKKIGYTISLTGSYNDEPFSQESRIACFVCRRT